MNLMRKPVFGRKPAPAPEIALEPVAVKHRIRSGIVRFVHDGSGWKETLCAPLFMYPQRGRTAVVPEGRFIVGSAEHLVRRRELGLA